MKIGFFIELGKLLIVFAVMVFALYGPTFYLESKKVRYSVGRESPIVRVTTLLWIAFFIVALSWGIPRLSPLQRCYFVNGVVSTNGILQGLRAVLTGRYPIIFRYSTPYVDSLEAPVQELGCIQVLFASAAFLFGLIISWENLFR